MNCPLVRKKGREANVSHFVKKYFFSEFLSKIGHSKHCSEEQCNLIREGKMYKEMQQTIGCSAKIMSNA